MSSVNRVVALGQLVAPHNDVTTPIIVGLTMTLKLVPCLWAILDFSKFHHVELVGDDRFILNSQVVVIGEIDHRILAHLIELGGDLD